MIHNQFHHPKREKCKLFLHKVPELNKYKFYRKKFSVQIQMTELYSHEEQGPIFQKLQAERQDIFLVISWKIFFTYLYLYLSICIDIHRSTDRQIDSMYVYHIYIYMLYEYNIWNNAYCNFSLQFKMLFIFLKLHWPFVE